MKSTTSEAIMPAPVSSRSDSQAPAQAQSAHKPRRHDMAWKWLFRAGVAILVLWVLVPIALLMLSSVSTPEQISGWPKTLTPALSFETLDFFWHYQSVISALGNSLLAAAFTMVIAIVLGAPAGYALARFVFPGMNAFRLIIILSRAFPMPLLALPLAAPGITASAVFAFVISWNEVFASAILTVENRTLTAFLVQSLSESPAEIKYAGGLILVVPALLFLFAIRKYLFSMWGISNR